MALTNTLHKQLDVPVWEWARFTPAVSSAISCTCTGDNSNFHPTHGRYIYYLIAAASFWRYDTWTDTYMQLSSPAVAPATWSSMVFFGSYGVEGNAIAAASTSITVAGYWGGVLKGYDVTIVAGTGVGQRRLVTSVADPVVSDSGVATAVGNAAGGITITDATKAWSINQWVGYNVRISGGSGVGQVRRILYNSATVLTLGDSAFSPNDPKFCNPVITSPAISAGAGVQSLYSIESSIVTVDSAWLTTPDTTSIYRFNSGGIMLASSAAATPFYTLQWYDVTTDVWYIRSSNSLMHSVVGTDGTIENTPEESSTWDRGFASGTGTTTTLTDSTKNWTINQWTGYYVRFFTGTGEGQQSLIASNTSTVLTFASVTSAPTVSTGYMIDGFDAGLATAGGASTLTDSGKTWATNRWSNYQVRITFGTGKGQVRAIASNTATVLTTILPWTTNPDTTSTYTIQGDNDKMLSMLGANASVLVHNMDDDLPSFGRWQDAGSARNASVQFGSNRALGIASLTHATTTATVTTTTNHNFKAGQSITVKGATDSNYNTTASIATVPSQTTFTYTMAGTPAADTLANSQSTTTLADATKSWTTNQWAGYLCWMTTTNETAATGAFTGQCLQITSNTATTLTFTVAGTAPTTGVSRYVISGKNAVIGASGTVLTGIATGAGQLTTALVDTGQAWVVNLYSGKRVKFLGGAGQAQEALITSNTATTLTFGIQTTAPIAASTSYAILDQPVRGTGIKLMWSWGTSDTAKRGLHMHTARGGAALGFDRLDITTDRFTLIPVTPQFETLGTGSQYAYDMADRIYFTKDATQRCYYFDVVTGTIHGASQFPYTAPTAIIGNRFEIFASVDGLKWIWTNRQSFQEAFKLLLSPW